MLLFAGWLGEAQLHASNALDADLSHWETQMSSKPRDWDSFRTGKQLCSLHGFPHPPQVTPFRLVFAARAQDVFVRG